MSDASSAATAAQPFPGRWKALAILAAGLSLIILDGTIVGVALPTMISALNLNLTDAQWVNAIYNVIFAALLLGAGRLGDRIGRRTTFATGVVLFVGGSLLAATASGPGSLIASRTVQGVGGALVLPSTLSSVNSLFQGKDRAAAFGIWGAVMSGMAALGPLLGLTRRSHERPPAFRTEGGRPSSCLPAGHGPRAVPVSAGPCAPRRRGG